MTNFFSVLFVDEAYTLAKKDDGKDFGHEAVAALLKDMEDYRGKFCVILAGYKQEMDEMISVNPGFRSRIPFFIDFPDYKRSELKEIAQEELSIAKEQIEKEDCFKFSFKIKRVYYIYG